MQRLLLFAALLCSSPLVRGQATAPVHLPSQPLTEFHSLVSILQAPDLSRWYALHPADPAPAYRAGLRGGGSVSDFIALTPQDTARVAGLYRAFLLRSLFDGLGHLISYRRNLAGLILTDVSWEPPLVQRRDQDTAYYRFRGHGLMRPANGGVPVYVIEAIFNVAPHGQLLGVNLSGVAPGGDAAAYKRWVDSMAQAPIGDMIAGPTDEEMASVGKEVRVTHRGVCGGAADSVVLTERYLRHPGGVRYLQAIAYEVNGASHPLLQTLGKYRTPIGYYGYQFEDPDTGRHWCLLADGSCKMGFIVSADYWPVCTLRLQEVQD